MDHQLSIVMITILVFLFLFVILTPQGDYAILEAFRILWQDSNTHNYFIKKKKKETPKTSFFLRVPCVFLTWVKLPSLENNSRQKIHGFFPLASFCGKSTSMLKPDAIFSFGFGKWLQLLTIRSGDVLFCFIGTSVILSVSSLQTQLHAAVEPVFFSMSYPYIYIDK